MYCFAFRPFSWGGTFAVIGKHFIGAQGNAGSKSAVLYGVNTLGALLGAFLTGFFLITFFGHFKVHIAASALNLLIGCLAIAINRLGHRPTSSPSQREKATVPRKTKDIQLSKATLAFVLLGTAAAGFSTMAYQVIWTRLLVLIIDNSGYSFTCIVMLFLGGIALGSFLVIPLFGLKKHLAMVFALFQIGFAASSFLLPFFIHPQQVSGETPYYLFLLRRLPFFAAVPALFSGAILPLAVQLYKRSTVDTGARLGRVYALNTLGCVLGAFAVSFCLIPVQGFRNSMLLLPALNLIIGCMVALTAAKPSHSIPVTAVAVVMAILGLKAMPPEYYQGQVCPDRIRQPSGLL